LSNDVERVKSRNILFIITVQLIITQVLEIITRIKKYIYEVGGTCSTHKKAIKA
jgi:hypothetical protein